MSYLILLGVITIVSWAVGFQLKRKFKEYSKLPTRSNLSGKEVAEKMLSDHGITDVQVIQVNGQLTDHYNPINKTINLSEVVYNERNVASAAVASHEVGHAVQHADAYAWLGLRSKLVPAVSLGSKFITPVLIGGIIVLSVFKTPLILGLGVLLFALTTLFSFITLPVEFDASKRAVAWIGQAGVVNSQEQSVARSALNWAAMTYVVAALASLATLLYYLRIFLSNR